MVVARNLLSRDSRESGWICLVSTRQNEYLGSSRHHFCPSYMHNDSMQSRIITVPYLYQDFNVAVSRKEGNQTVKQIKILYNAYILYCIFLAFVSPRLLENDIFQSRFSTSRKISCLDKHYATCMYWTGCSILRGDYDFLLGDVCLRGPSFLSMWAFARFMLRRKMPWLAVALDVLPSGLRRLP